VNRFSCGRADANDKTYNLGSDTERVIGAVLPSALYIGASIVVRGTSYSAYFASGIVPSCAGSRRGRIEGRRMA
jgi:hypothetical protein